MITTTTTATPSRPPDLRRTRSYAQQVSAVLTTAFTLSAGYTAYTTVSGKVTEGFTATSPVAWAFYAVGFGAALGIRRSDRRRTWWALGAYEVVLLALAVLVYPDEFTPPLQTTVGWLENDLYVGLVVVAGYLTIQRLRELTLSPSRPDAP